MWVSPGSSAAAAGADDTSGAGTAVLRAPVFERSSMEPAAVGGAAAAAGAAATGADADELGCVTGVYPAAPGVGTPKIVLVALELGRRAAGAGDCGCAR